MRRLLLLTGAAMLWAVLAPPADAREMEIEHLHSDIEVRADGVVAIKETIHIRFEGSWNGIYRHIPYRYYVNGGGTIGLEPVSIEDHAGTKLEHWTRRANGSLELKIRVPGAVNAVRVVVIRYETLGVIQRYGDDDPQIPGHDELYWNVNGTAWQVPFKRVSCTVRLPKGVPADSIRTRAYLGRQGFTGGQDAVVITRGEDGSIHFEGKQGLGPREGVTIVVGWAPGFVDHPGWWRRFLWSLKHNLFIFVPAIPFLLMLVFWLILGRDPRRRRTIIPEFETPEELSPIEAGVLVDDRIDGRDVSATIVDLARRGILKIVLPDGDGKPRLTRAKNWDESKKVKALDRVLIKALFHRTSTSVTMKNAGSNFRSDGHKVHEAVMKRLVKHRLFADRPDKTITKWRIFVGFAYAFLLMVATWVEPHWMYLVTMVLFGILSWKLTRAMPRRTRKGRELLTRIEGVQEYLVTAEADRMKTLPLGTLERLIPYAIALGVHERWLPVLAEVTQKPPAWIQGATSDFSWSRIGDDFGNDVNTAFTAGPRVSSSSGGGSWSGSSGFSGGGFSGGGFGGGGGGGW